MHVYDLLLLLFMKGSSYVQMYVKVHRQFLNIFNPFCLKNNNYINGICPAPCEQTQNNNAR